MRCRTAMYAIHLDREGECRPGLRKRAIEHASLCPDCSEELRRIGDSAKPLARLRDAVPRLSDPEALTQAIMREVERPRGRDRHAAAGWPLSLVSSQRLRLVLHSAAWTIALLFAGQTLLDADSMSALEERLTLQASAQPRTAGPPVGGSPRLDRTLAGIGSLAGVDAETLLRELRISPQSAPPELDRLRAKYPDLWTIALHDGLDERERKILLAQGPALLKELEQLITLGGRTNEP